MMIGQLISARIVGVIRALVGTLLRPKEYV
jgi:hypothetical protein